MTPCPEYTPDVLKPPYFYQHLIGIAFLRHLSWIVTMKTGGFSCGKESLLQEVNTQRETKQELFVGRGGAFRRQNGAFRRAEAGSAGKQWAAKGPAIRVQEAAGLRNRGTRTDRKRRPQTLQGSDKRESVTGTDIAQW